MTRHDDASASTEATLRDTATALAAVFVQDLLGTAAVAARAGRYTEAAASLTQLARTTTASISVLDLLARIEAQRGRPARAAFLWERVLESDAKNQAALSALGALRRGARAGGIDPREIADLVCSTAAVITTARDGAVLGWSEPAAALFGWSADEVHGRSVSMLFQAKHARLDARDAREALRGRSVSGARVRCVRRNRVEFVAYCDLSAVLDTSGAPIGVRRRIVAAT